MDWIFLHNKSRDPLSPDHSLLVGFHLSSWSSWLLTQDDVHLRTDPGLWPGPSTGPGRTGEQERGPSSSSRGCGWKLWTWDIRWWRWHLLSRRLWLWQERGQPRARTQKEGQQEEICNQRRFAGCGFYCDILGPWQALWLNKGCTCLHKIFTILRVRTYLYIQN